MSWRRTEAGSVLALALAAGCGGGGSPAPTGALVISTASLAAASVATPYAANLAAAGGAGGYRWAIAAGSLPAGLALSASGQLAGTPSTAGIATFSVTVTDAANPPHSASGTFNLIVGATGAGTQVMLASAPSSIAVGSSFAGLSYEKSKLNSALFAPGDATLIALFNRLGPGLLRIGGNSVDHTPWNGSGAGLTAGETAPADVDRLAGFLHACNWQVLYGIEFLNEAASPVGTADPSLVAAEAVYAMQSLGDRLYGFELGNEPDLYSTQIPGFTYADYQSQWQTYRQAILAAVAGAQAAGTLPSGSAPVFTGPAAAFDQSGYIAPFAQAEAASILLLTRHYYLANGQSPSSTMPLLLTPDPNLPGELSAIAASASNNHIPGGYRLAEANSFYNGGAPGVSDAVGSALWAIGFLFNNAWAGSAGVNFHGGGNGPGYTPIGDDGTAVASVRPEYYGIYLFSQAANGQLLAATTAPSSTTLSAYALQGGGTTWVMLVNTSATLAGNVQVQFPAGISQVRFVTLTGPSLESTEGELLNGAPINVDGTWNPLTPPPLPVTGASVVVPVPAGSALLLQGQ